MTSTSDQSGAGVQANSLQSLLDAIDRKTAPALQLDLARLKERSAEGQRVQTLHISFVVGWHEMALPIHAMQEIGDMPVITPLPHLPPPKLMPLPPFPKPLPLPNLFLIMPKPLPIP